MPKKKWLLFLLLGLTLAVDLHLEDHAVSQKVPARESVQLQINSSYPYVYVSVMSCGMPAMEVSQRGVPVPPQDILPASGFLYSINETLQLVVNSTHIEKPTQVVLIGLQGQRDLPKNSWKIMTEISEEYLKVSFRAAKVFDKHVRASYSLWFSRTPAQMDCWMFANAPPAGAAGVIRTLPIDTDEKDTIEVWVPVNNIYPELGNNTYSNKEQIVALINQFENFYVGVLAEVSTPYALSFQYELQQVEHRLSIVDLEGGLAILLLGMLVFGIVSIVYLFVKRKYKDRDEFQEEYEIEVDADSNQQDGADHGPTAIKL